MPNKPFAADRKKPRPLKSTLGVLPPENTKLRKKMCDLLKEYEILRNEITENSRLVANVFIANTTVTAAIIGYGLSIESPLGPVFLAPLAILIPSLFFIASQLETTTIISQYLRVILEPKLEIKWQNHWYELRKQQLLPKVRKYVPAVSGLYGALSFVCLILALLNWNTELWVLGIVIIVVTVPLMLAVRAIRHAFSMEFREAMAKAWLELKEMEK